MKGNGMMDGGMGIWMLISMIFWVSLLVAIIVLAVWVVQKTTRGGTGRKEESAVEILKKWSSSGEISKEEYEEIKKDL